MGGPGLAARAFAAGLVDECHLLLAPIAVGGGTRSLPDDLRVRLELRDERRFANGMVHLHYRVTRVAVVPRSRVTERRTRLCSERGRLRDDAPEPWEGDTEMRERDCPMGRRET